MGEDNIQTNNTNLHHPSMENHFRNISYTQGYGYINPQAHPNATDQPYNYNLYPRQPLIPTYSDSIPKQSTSAVYTDISNSIPSRQNDRTIFLPPHINENYNHNIPRQSSSTFSPDVLNSTADRQNDRTTLSHVHGNITLMDNSSQSLMGNNANSIIHNNLEVPKVNKETNYVYNIVRHCFMGQLLLDAYEYDKKMLEVIQKDQVRYHRQFKHTLFAELIIGHEFHRAQSYKMTPDRFYFLKNSIKELLPSEPDDLWYTSSNYDYNGSKPAKGYLYSAYVTLRGKASAIGREVDGKKGTKRKRSDIDSELTAVLNFSGDIDNQYLQDWDDSWVKRSESFKILSLSDIYDKYSALTSADGHLLISRDFVKLYPNLNNTFKNNWPTAMIKIIHLARKKNNEIIKKLLSDLDLKINELSIIDENTEEGTKKQIQDLQSDCALQLLPALLFLQNKGKWKFSKANIDMQKLIDHFYAKAEIEDHLEETIINLQKDLQEYELDITPIVVAVKNNKNVTVAIKNCRYNFQSPVDAIDLCYKAMKIFKTPFCKITSNIYLFIEYYILSFESKSTNRSLIGLKGELDRQNC